MKRLTPDQAAGLLTEKENYINPKANGYGFTLTPSKDPVRAEDGWDEVTYYSSIPRDFYKNLSNPANNGFVYVLYKPSQPGVTKIGMTDRTVEERAKEINSATGVIIPWEIGFRFPCSNALALEKEVHSHFSNRNISKEGFSVTLEEAIEIIEDLGGKYQITD